MSFCDIKIASVWQTEDMITYTVLCAFITENVI